MTKEEAFSKKEQYVEYITQKIDEAHSLREWHQETFGETLTDQDVSKILGDDRLSGATHVRMAAHQRYMAKNR